MQIPSSNFLQGIDDAHFVKGGQPLMGIVLSVRRSVYQFIRLSVCSCHFNGNVTEKSALREG